MRANVLTWEGDMSGRRSGVGMSVGKMSIYFECNWLLQVSKYGIFDVTSLKSHILNLFLSTPIMQFTTQSRQGARVKPP